MCCEEQDDRALKLWVANPDTHPRKGLRTCQSPIVVGGPVDRSLAHKSVWGREVIPRIVV